MGAYFAHGATWFITGHYSRGVIIMCGFQDPDGMQITLFQTGDNPDKMSSLG